MLIHDFVKKIISYLYYEGKDHIEEIFILEREKRNYLCLDHSRQNPEFDHADFNCFRFYQLFH